MKSRELKNREEYGFISTIILAAAVFAVLTYAIITPICGALAAKSVKTELTKSTFEVHQRIRALDQRIRALESTSDSHEKALKTIFDDGMETCTMKNFGKSQKITNNILAAERILYQQELANAVNEKTAIGGSND